ncbi:MAG: hypothetical protein Fur0043_07460 [Anaerolineales bacterium]
MNIVPRSFLLLALLLTVAMLPGCAPRVNGTPLPPTTDSPRGVPTWTPRPADLTAALPTPARAVSSPQRASVTPFTSATPTNAPAPVIVQAVGGNLHIRRGPSVDYNSIDVLRSGQSLTATARDPVNRWLQIPLPSAPGKSGWVSILTDYSLVSGVVEDLPIATVAPAVPAFIRNCTKHRMLVLPPEVELLGKYDAPYNEERFPPGEYQVYDLEAGNTKAYQTVILSEGSRVDIREDGLGEKSKCE